MTDKHLDSIEPALREGQSRLRSSTNQMTTSQKKPRGLNGHRERLRKRFLNVGTEGFAEHELLELVLTLAIPRRDVKPQAKQLLDAFGSLPAILDAPREALRCIDGIGDAAITALGIIKAVAEVYVRQGVESSSGRPLLGDLSPLWQMRIGGLPHEVFEVAYLDSKLQLLPAGIERVAEGTIDRAAVYSRRVMEAAVNRRAASLVFAHNHPNGIAEPTEQDKLLTRALVLAAETLEIHVIDHLIVTRDKVFSFQKEGLL
jgi:DNA repair protein RadC